MLFNYWKKFSMLDFQAFLDIFMIFLKNSRYHSNINLTVKDAPYKAKAGTEDQLNSFHWVSRQKNTKNWYVWPARQGGTSTIWICASYIYEVSSVRNLKTLPKKNRKKGDDPRLQRNFWLLRAKKFTREPR